MPDKTQPADSPAPDPNTFAGRRAAREGQPAQPRRQFTLRAGNNAPAQQMEISRVEA